MLYSTSLIKHNLCYIKFTMLCLFSVTAFWCGKNIHFKQQKPVSIKRGISYVKELVLIFQLFKFFDWQIYTKHPILVIITFFVNVHWNSTFTALSWSFSQLFIKYVWHHVGLAPHWSLKINQNLCLFHKVVCYNNQHIR